MTRYVVGTVDEIPPGARKIVDIASRSVGVFNVNGSFYAIRNSCPHAGGPLCEGPVSGLVTSDAPGEYHYAKQGEIVRCPWHGWEFSILTGQSWFDPARTRVAVYAASVESSEALADDSELVEAGYQPGPYQAERYQVDIDRQYVIVHV